MHPDGPPVALALTVTAKGQVTLGRAMLYDLGVMPGAKVSVSVIGERTDRAGRRCSQRRRQKPAQCAAAIGQPAGLARRNLGSD